MSLTNLKLLLNPSQEAEAAIAGLDQITNLMLVYKWKEKSFFEVEDFRGLATRLYIAILEYQALLLDHIHRNPIKKWAKDVFGAGEWTERLKAINQHDAHCKKLTDAIDANETKEWRHEERSRHERLLQQLCQDGVEERRSIRSLYSNYEADKNVNPERISGTCEWFLSHPSFISWRESQSSSLLLVTADPGCGKSVLTKYLVDRKGTSLTAMKEPPTVCYFFFKDGDPKRMNSANSVCALLHQLIMQHPHLYKHAREDFQNKNETFLSDFNAVWNIFLKAAEDLLDSEVICVLDALDECSATSRDTLIARLEDLYVESSPRTTSKSTLKFLITSRPDFNVIRAFKTSRNSSFEVRLRGEEESEQVSREIDLVIRHKVQEIGFQMDLNASEESDLKVNLLQVTHRTYLWLHLTLDFITKKLDIDRNDIAMITKTVPATVDEAYTAILNKSPDRAKARRLLHIVLAARRPLTLEEANVALVMNEEYAWYSDLPLRPSKTLEEKIKNMCGLFLSVVDSKVYLIHQTAREFLTRVEHTDTCCREPTPSTWKNAYCLERSNKILAEICIHYLDLKDFQSGLQEIGFQSELVNTNNEDAVLSQHEEDVDEKAVDQYENNVLSQYEEKFVFLTYAAQHWGQNFYHAGYIPDNALVRKVALITSNPTRPSFDIWFSSFTNAQVVIKLSHRSPSLMIASYFGHDRVVQFLLAHTDVQINVRSEFGWTALTMAAYEGHESIVKLLLDHKEVEVNAQGVVDETALIGAAEGGHESIVKLLLAHKNVKVNTQDRKGKTALTHATRRGHESIAKLLLAEGAHPNLHDKYGDTPLSFAARHGNEEIVRLLLMNGAKTDMRDEAGYDPYFYAMKRGHVRVAEIIKAHDEHRENKEGDEVSEIEDDEIA